jgi:Fe-S-cluster containining protein
MTEHEQKYAVRVTPSDKIRFRCTLCGACCRNVKETVPVDCKDAFYLTKHLRDLGMDIYCVDQFLEQYAEPALLDECGFFVYFLKSVGKDNACIFLKDNRCSVQEVKPLACKLYPFMVDPNESGNFRYLYSRERTHHFHGPAVETRSWMKKNFPQESRAFMQVEYTQAGPIAAQLRNIQEHRKTEALLHFHRLRYSELDLDKPFQEQFQRNQEKLIEILSRMAD